MADIGGHRGDERIVIRVALRPLPNRPPPLPLLRRPITALRKRRHRQIALDRQQTSRSPGAPETATSERYAAALTPDPPPEALRPTGYQTSCARPPVPCVSASEGGCQGSGGGSFSSPQSGGVFGGRGARHGVLAERHGRTVLIALQPVEGNEGGLVVHLPRREPQHLFGVAGLVPSTCPLNLRRKGIEQLTYLWRPLPGGWRARRGAARSRGLDGPNGDAGRRVTTATWAVWTTPPATEPASVVPGRFPYQPFL